MIVPEQILRSRHAPAAKAPASHGRLLRYENRLVLILAFAGGVAALDAQAVFYLMPFIASEFAMTNAQIGVIGSAVLIGWAVSGIVVARVSDRIGRRKPFLIAAFACFALLSGLSALAVGFITLLLARLLIGGAEGPVIPIKQAMVMAESTPSRRGLNMGLVQNLGAQLLGTMIAPLVLVAVAQASGWRAAFLLAGVPGLLAAFLIWRFLREPPSGRDEDRRATPLSRPGWRTLLRNRNLVLCMLIALMSVGWFFILLTFLPLYLVRELGLSAGSMSVVMSVIGMAGVLSAVIVPLFADRRGRRAAIGIFCAIGAVAPLGAILAGSSPFMIGTMLMAGCLMLGTFPLVMATVPQESVAATDAATATSLVIAVAQLGGGVVGPIAAGWLVDRAGSAAPMWLAAMLAVGATGLALFLRETRPQAPANPRTVEDDPYFRSAPEQMNHAVPL